MKAFLEALRGLFFRPAMAATVTAAVAIGAYQFTERSRINLEGVQPPLITVTQCAYDETKAGFVVIDGMRTEEEQKRNVAGGVSWTLRSRHLTGHAIDFAALHNGKVTFEPKFYPPIADAFNRCSIQHGIPIIWGGEWKQKDYGHIELDRKTYP